MSKEEGAKGRKGRGETLHRAAKAIKKSRRKITFKNDAKRLKGSGPIAAEAIENIISQSKTEVSDGADVVHENDASDIASSGKELSEGTTKHEEKGEDASHELKEKATGDRNVSECGPSSDALSDKEKEEGDQGGGRETIQCVGGDSTGPNGDAVGQFSDEEKGDRQDAVEEETDQANDQDNE